MRFMRVGVVAVVLALIGLTATSALAGKRVRHQKVVSVGVVLSQHGAISVALFKVHSSLDGNGAAIQSAKVTGSAFPLKGTDRVTAYYADGVARTKDKFVLGVPNAAGVAKVTGSGKCAGGTRVHKHQRCSYKLHGTYNTKTLSVHVTSVGSISG
jgi:hypothetical protein